MVPGFLTRWIENQIEFYEYILHNFYNNADSLRSPQIHIQDIFYWFLYLEELRLIENRNYYKIVFCYQYLSIRNGNTCYQSYMA